MNLSRRNKKDNQSIPSTEGWVENVAKEIEKIEDPKIASKTTIERYRDCKRTLQPNELGELASEMVEKLVKTQGISSEVATEVISIILSDEDVPNQDIMEPVKEVLPEKQKFEIVSTVDIPVQEKQEIVQSMEDEKLRKEAEEQLRKEEKKKKENQIKKQLREIYSTSDTEETIELIGKLKEIKAKNRSSEIYKMLERCIARKIAIEWRISWATRIRTLT